MYHVSTQWKKRSQGQEFRNYHTNLGSLPHHSRMRFFLYGRMPQRGQMRNYFKRIHLLPKQKILRYLERTIFRTKGIHLVKEHLQAQDLPLEVIKSVTCLRKNLLQKGSNNLLMKLFPFLSQVLLTNSLLQRWESLHHTLQFFVSPIAAL